MVTGFKELDKLINLNKPELILLSGRHFIDMLSGDIANNIMLKQDDEKYIHNVLEVVDSKKEYLIKRIFVNESNVNYKKWTLKNQYTAEELKQIGQATVNLIEVTKRLPTIIEQEDIYMYDLKKLTKYIREYANHYADREPIYTLIILDVLPLNRNDFRKIKTKNIKRNIRRKMDNVRKEIKTIKFVKKVYKISHELNCPVIIVYGIDNDKVWNREKGKYNFITKEDLFYINKINKFIDKFVILNNDETADIECLSIFDVDVYDRKNKIGSCKLQYNHTYRKFEDYKE